MTHHHEHVHAKLDGVGFWLSAICAVHCLVMPIVLVFFPVITWIHWSRSADIVVLAIAAAIGLGGCLLGRRHHGQFGPVLLVVAGLVLNVTGRFTGALAHPVLAQTLTAAGPLFIAYGMWRDRRLCAGQAR